MTGHLSLKRLHGGGLRGVPSLGSLEDILKRPLDAGVSLHGGPFPHRELLTCEGGLIYWGLR